MSLKGKVAVVTGSTSGIGLAIARALAGEGAAVMLNGFGNADEIERLRAGMADGFGVDVAYFNADMSNPAEVEGLVEAAEAVLGSVDILVNNAGIQHVDPVEAFPVERWQAVLGVNLSGVFFAIRAALPVMQRRGWGRIVNVASVHGLVASIHKAAYVAAKHGVVGLTKVVALETAKTAVTCNAICPGWVRTPLVEQQIKARAEAEKLAVEAAAEQLLEEKQPSLRFATPEDIGALTVFLCSDAAANITGASLPVDGGWTAQ
jgi:3-hydroxybutyrate dehydrogenase